MLLLDNSLTALALVSPRIANSDRARNLPGWAMHSGRDSFHECEDQVSLAAARSVDMFAFQSVISS